MSVAKLKKSVRSINDKKKVLDAIINMIGFHERQTDELRGLYKAVTGDCYSCTVMHPRRCWRCETEEARAAYDAKKADGRPA